VKTFQLTLTDDALAQAAKTADERGWTTEQLLAYVLAGGLQVEADVNDACLPVTEEWTTSETPGVEVRVF